MHLYDHFRMNPDIYVQNSEKIMLVLFLKEYFSIHTFPLLSHKITHL